MPSEKSIGTYVHDGNNDAQKFVQKTIQNDGAFIPTGLSMIQNLRSVTNGQNPTAIESVGLGNFTQALSAISALFSSGSDNKNKSNTNPCSIPEAQRTPEQQYDCDVLTSIANAQMQAANSAPTS